MGLKSFYLVEGSGFHLVKGGGFYLVKGFTACVDDSPWRGHGSRAAALYSSGFTSSQSSVSMSVCEASHPLTMEPSAAFMQMYEPKKRW